MPAKGSKFSLGNRDYIFNKNYYNEKFLTNDKISLSFSQCKNIIETCNKNIAESVVEETDGFKLPFGMGYLCIVKFLPKKDPIDWKKTKEIGRKVYHLNFHTLGYAIRSYWFRVGRINNVRFHEVFKFKPYKTLSKAMSSAFKNGKMYSEWSVSDFIEKSRLENLYTKKYRKEQKE